VTSENINIIHIQEIIVHADKRLRHILSLLFVKQLWWSFDVLEPWQFGLDIRKRPKITEVQKLGIRANYRITASVMSAWSDTVTVTVTATALVFPRRIQQGGAMCHVATSHIQWSH